MVEEVRESESGTTIGYILPRWFVLLAGILMTLGSPWATWITVKAFNMERDLAVIQASRFDAKDGQDIWKEISAIRQSIAVMPTQSRLDKFEEKQSEILQRMGVLEVLIKNQRLAP